MRRVAGQGLAMVPALARAARWAARAELARRLGRALAAVSRGETGGCRVRRARVPAARTVRAVPVVPAAPAGARPQRQARARYATSSARFLLLSAVDLMMQG